MMNHYNLNGFMLFEGILISNNVEVYLLSIIKILFNLCLQDLLIKMVWLRSIKHCCMKELRGMAIRLMLLLLSSSRKIQPSQLLFQISKVYKQQKEYPSYCPKPTANSNTTCTS